MNLRTFIHWSFGLVLFLGISTSALAQEIDWNNYHRLKAQGKVPEIFRMPTQEKIDLDFKKERSMSTEQKVVFLEHIHYGLDELLNSGLVLFGDPCTEYVRKVADNLLKDSGHLRKDLQFYVIKSNLTNALSTDQGIVFVTLGLLAQVENEAQLAYVLAHEIAHYQEHHVEESFQNTQSIRHTTSYNERIRNMSNHSKEKELEADKLGIKLYHAAGYKKSELLSAFDVLMYSYLPFDEVPFPKDYYNTERLFIPESYYPESINPILADEDYDDEKSTHPNIRKRKDAITEAIKEYENWGNKEEVLPLEEFRKIRKIARFEGVHRNLVDCEYAHALYSIFLLEKEDPNSLFLARSKAKAWLGLANFKDRGAFAEAVDNPSDVEGESHAVYYLLRKLSKIQLYTVAMRQIEDLNQQFANDTELVAIRKKMCGLLANYSNFKIEKYRKINLQTAVERFEKSKLPAPETPDSLLNGEQLDSLNGVSEDEEGLSKYDKIRKKREAEEEEVVETEDEEFDYESFHLYALVDLISNADFEKELNQIKEETREKEEKEAERRALSRSELKKLQKEEYYLGYEEIVLLKPLAVQYYYGESQVKESSLLEAKILESLRYCAEKTSIRINDLSDINASNLEVESYNRQAMLLDYLRQKSANEGEDIFPVDSEEMIVAKKEAFNNAPLLFVLADFSKTMATRRVSMIFLVVDAADGELIREKTVFFSSAPKKNLLNGYVYEVLDSIGEDPKK
jgi:hypothetical protein